MRHHVRDVSAAKSSAMDFAMIHEKVDNFREKRAAHKRHVETRVLQTASGLFVVGFAVSFFTSDEQTGVSFLCAGLLTVTLIDIDYNLCIARHAPQLFMFMTVCGLAISGALSVTVSVTFALMALPSIYGFCRHRHILDLHPAYPLITDLFIIYISAYNAAITSAVLLNCFVANSAVDSEECGSVLGRVTSHNRRDAPALFMTVILGVLLSVGPCAALWWLSARRYVPVRRSGSSGDSSSNSNTATMHRSVAFIIVGHGMTAGATLGNAAEASLAELVDMWGVAAHIAICAFAVGVALSRRVIYGVLCRCFERRQGLRDGAFIVELLDDCGSGSPSRPGGPGAPTATATPASRILQAARSNLRCVEWAKVDLALFESSNGGPETFALSRPVKVGEGEAIDAFVSHSWHDDPRQKYGQLSRWCGRFRAEHGRDPTLWIDKVCIDQSRITDGLRMLPVNIMACEQVLVLYGPTYAKRLWCVLELFCVFAFSPDHAVAARKVAVEAALPARRTPPGQAPAAAAAAASSPTGFSGSLANPAADGLSKFDLAKAHCFDPKEEAKLRLIIAATGKDAFVGAVREFGAQLRTASNLPPIQTYLALKT